MRKILGLLLAVIAMGGSALAADEFKIDPAHSSVNFSVTHMMVSTVNGRFTTFEGKILFDDKDVDMPFELKGPVEAGKGKVMGAHGSLTVNRQDYGVGKATPMISNEVKIDLNVEARMAPPAPAGK